MLTELFKQDSVKVTVFSLRENGAGSISLVRHMHEPNALICT